MSNTAVENEVVRMQFDNRQFEAGVKQSMSTLDKLKAALHLDKSAQGFKQIGDAAKKVNFNPITNGIEGVKRSFSAMDIAFATAVARMTNDAITAGKRIATALTIDPVKTGLSEYETKLKAVQVMKANKGGSIEEITEALNELNTYADKTIYNFAQMTDNVGKFVAQGMKAKEAATAVQGMANLAGASGASAEAMSRATYQMSQVMGKGSIIHAQDWRSLRNADMANAQLKEVLIAVAKSKEFNADVDAAIRKKGNFEQSLEEGWLSSDIFKEALQIYSNAYDEATLKTKGYTDEQIKMFIELAKSAEEATTSVRTLSQLWDVIKETAQSGWTQSWEWIIGDLDEAKRIWTNLNNMISGYIDKVSDARNKLLEIWATGYDSENVKMDEEGNPIQDVLSSANLTGRQEVLLGLSEFMHSITEIANSIRAAFVDIFPPMTAKRAVELSHSFRKLMQAIKPTYEELSNIFYAVRGVLSVIGLFRDILAEVIKALFPVFSTARDLNEIILQAAGFIGQLLYATTKWLRESGTIHTVVTGISKVIGELLKQIGRIIVQIFRIIHETGLDRFLVKLIGWIGNALVYAIEHAVKLITKFADIIERMVPRVKAFFGGFVEAVKSGKLIDYLVDKFKSLGKAIAEIGKGDGTNTFFTKLGKFYSAAIDVISKAVVATYKWAKSLDLTQGIAIALSVIFGGLLFRLSGLIKAMTLFTKNWSAVGTSISKFFNRIKMHNPVILEMAVFVGALAASLKAISTIPTKQLWSSVGAIAALAAILSGLAIAITKVTQNISVMPREMIMGMVIIMTTLSIATLSLSKSLKTLSNISGDDLWKSIKAIAGIMLELTGISFLIMKFAPSLSISSAVMLLFCATLAKAIKTILKIDFSMLEGVSKQLIWTAALLGAAALTLGIGIEKFAFSISRIGFGLLLIAGTFYVLSKIKLNISAIVGMIVAVIAITSLMKVLADAARGFSDTSDVIVGVGASSRKQSGMVKEFTKGILRLVTAIGMLVLIRKMAEMLKWNPLAVMAVVGAIGAVIALLAVITVAGVLAKGAEESIKQLSRTLISITILMGTMLVLCTAISFISYLPGGIGIIWNAVAVFAALNVAVGILLIMARNGSEVKMLPILALMMGITSMFTILVILAGLDVKKIEAATKAIVSVIQWVGIIIFALSKIKASQAAGNVGIILSITSVLLAFSATMTALSRLDSKKMWEDITALGVTIFGLMSIVTAMSVLANILKVEGPNLLYAGGTMLALSATLLLISAALNMIPEKASVTGAISIIAVFAALTTAFGILGANGAIWSGGITALAASLASLGGSLLTITGAIVLAIVALGSFGAAMYLISKIDVSNGLMTILGLIAVMGTLAFIAPMIEGFSASLIGFGVALLMISGAALLGSLAINNIGKSLLLLNNVNAGKIAKVGAALLSLTVGMAGLSIVGITVIPAAGGLGILSAALVGMSDVNYQGISNGIALISIALTAMVPNLFTMIGSTIGLHIFGKELSNLAPVLTMCAISMNELVFRMSEFIGIKSTFITAGNQIGDGLKYGLAEGLRAANNELSRGANGLIGTFKSILGIHSPSLVFYNLGLYVMKGLANGEKDGTDEVTAVLGDATKQMTDTVEQGCDGLIATGKVKAREYVDTYADELTSGASKQKVADATEKVSNEAGQKASNKTAEAILQTAGIIASAAANAGNNAGVSFVNSLASVVQQGMPQITGWINGQIGKIDVGNFAVDKFDPSKISYDEYVASATGAEKAAIAANVKEYFVEQYGEDGWKQYYKEWEQGTTENFKTSKLKSGWKAGFLGDAKDTAKAIKNWWYDGGFVAAFQRDDAFNMDELTNSVYGYMDSLDLSTEGLYDYATKVQTVKRVTEKEFEAIKNNADLKTLTMSEEGRLNHLKFGDVNFTEEAMREKGYEYNAKDKTWYKYFSVKNKDGKEEIEVIQKETSAMDGLTESTDKLGKTAKETESEMETFTKALNSNLKSAMNYFDEFKYGTEEDKISKKDLLKNLEDQHNGMINWAKDMQELASRGMSKDLWKNLAEEGPASYAKVKAFLDMTASELQQANDWFSRDLALPDVTTVYMQQLLGSYYGDYSELFIARGKAAGEDLNKGTKEGLEKNLDETKAAAESAGSQVADKYTHDGTGEGSPSWKTREAGEYMNLGLIEGLKNNLKMVLRFAAKCGDTIVKMYSRNLDPKLMRSIGKSMMVGLINGITSETNHLFKLIDEITSKVPKFIKDGWGIKSPSRLFKSFGMYAMEGLALGLSQYSTLAEAAASETADNTAKTLNGITNSVLDWDTDFNPVITPTLNLDNVTRGVREINDMFKETTLDTVVEDPVQNGGATAQPSTTFIQNNYSPKHLSSIDIYRQTRNQLSSLKGAMG